MDNDKNQTAYTLIKATFTEPLLLTAVLLGLTSFAGNAFAGMFGTALMIFGLAYGCFMFVTRRRIVRVVRMFHDNEFYINAGDYARGALYKSLLTVLVPALALLFFGNSLARVLTDNDKTRLVFYVCAILLIVTATEGVLAGYAEGMGRKKTILLYEYLRAVISAVLAVLGGLYGRAYGKKVDALLFTTDCVGAYAALFAFLGILTTHILMLILLYLTKRRIIRSKSPLHETGKPRYMGEKNAFYGAVWQQLTAVSTIFLAVLITAAIAAGSGKGEQVKQLGLFYGHYLPYVVITCVLSALPFIRQAYEQLPAYEQAAAPAFYKSLRVQSMLCFPIGAFLMALAGPLEGSLFRIGNDTAELLLLIGGFLAPLLSFALPFATLFVLNRKMMPLLAASLISLACSIPVSVVISVTAGKGILGVPVALMTAGFVFDLVSVILLKILFKMRSVHVLRMMAKPLALSVLSALGIFLLSSGLAYIIGDFPTCVLCIFLGSALYLILMSIFRGIEDSELEAIPGGKILERISMRGRVKNDSK